ncbi:VF530 family protein [Opitutia bacterium ISCC 51]|nr:VF530 family protein [Opitutae bacterium ISCC 51]QXD28783.1 VF530 family protein [Opitutae bacterium ISCC 52]
MPDQSSKDPLHGMTLEKIIKNLVEYYGWEELGKQVRIDCFNFDPSLSSSLKFLRRTPWAREKVEQLYIRTLKREQSD